MSEMAEHESKNGSRKGMVSKILTFPLTRIVVGGVVCTVVPLALNALLKSILAPDIFDEEVARMIRAGLFCTASLLTYYMLFTYYEVRRVGELSPRHLPREGLWGLGGSVFMISVIVLALILAGYYEVLSTNASLFNFLYLSIIIASLAAFEEIVFRGIGYRIAERWLGTNLALLLTSLLFGLSHVSNEGATIASVLGAGIGGALAGIMFTLTKRLWLPIFFHTGWNLSQAFFGGSVSGMEEFMPFAIVAGKMQGPDILTGGSFGLENSSITIALTAILFVVLYVWAMKRGCLVAPSWR